MPEPVRMGLGTRTLLSAWAFLTLILFFTVILLAGELISRGQNPLEVAFTAEPPPPPVAPSESSSRAKEIQLRFADA